MTELYYLNKLHQSNLLVVTFNQISMAVFLYKYSRENVGFMFLWLSSSRQ